MNLYPLDLVETLAAQICAGIAQYCVNGRVAVAGSVRRKVPRVHDLDLVLVPKSRERLQARCLNRCAPIESGEKHLAFTLPMGMRVDIYYAHLGLPDLYAPEPCNWGSVLLCRTGSASHNVRICTAAAKRGLTWQINRGLIDASGAVVASATEDEMFAAVGMDPIPPESRT